MQHIIQKNINENYDIDKIYKEILEKGYSLFNIGKIAKDEFLNFCYNFGEVIPSGRNKRLVDDIFINDGTGTEKLPFHTDKTYWRIPPRFEILYVNDVNNMNLGEITLVSLMDAFNSLSSSEKENIMLYQSEYKNPPNRDKGENPCANFINTIDGKIEFFRYRLDIFDSNKNEIKKMKKYIENEDNITYIKYKKGDILILDNWKYAAGRNNTIWGENGFRHLFRTLII